MPVAHFKGDFCNIDSFKPTSNTLDGIKEMNRVINISNMLERILAGVPLFQLFASRSPAGSIVINGSVSVATTGYNVTRYDWNLFSQALKGVGDERRSQLQKIAGVMAFTSSGKDYDFWRCVSNAL
ncbi:hypothetical protein VA7868_02918 [Vibrio aerogenes CECT 7868]|uniref:Uncharacterized protein n=1 Tax=Vibrio aerogenes CECT 7868 TaxID=1216006 RepID=A0A1M5ZM52_9VIBR|nr:hypothetical protein [Vibrio aerogenes]SHI25251.1 hypothetical protein VA7868_02918 [Vibrio aerogenes CECT 7868]